MRDSFLKFTGLITSIMRNIRKMITETVSRYGIKRSYAIPIYFLYKNGPLSATKLCELCGEDKANVSRTLKALEEDGYIAREDRPTSRSRVRMVLTAEGYEVGGFLAARISESVALATAGVAHGDIDVMYSVLSAIEKNLESALDRFD